MPLRSAFSLPSPLRQGAAIFDVEIPRERHGAPTSPRKRRAVARPSRDGRLLVSLALAREFLLLVAPSLLVLVDSQLFLVCCAFVLVSACPSDAVTRRLRSQRYLGCLKVYLKYDDGLSPPAYVKPRLRLFSTWRRGGRISAT